jgi:hypothetical protein
LSRRGPAEHAAAIARELTARRSFNTVKNPDMRILDCLAGLAGHHGKTYTGASQKKICELLARIYGRVMSVRTLNRHLNALCRLQFMRRRRRHRRDPKRGFVFRSTLCIPQWRYLTKCAKTVRGLFSLMREQGREVGSTRMTQLAQHLTGFFNSVISTPANNAGAP